LIKRISFLCRSTIFDIVGYTLEGHHMWGKLKLFLLEEAAGVLQCLAGIGI
jgi:hypothetical protein